ncbi:helix-turn-helix domain-containing protein [Corynebacterium otitidis]|uniref:helix-turn-helix domain-containing protein n=1 Tax=Corynebacterium otitidis TaxID=29321 RepID=UPI000627AF05|nr:helix-turn-helix transcriptional regulator [Corynebacterium otitidis]KKO84373.1 transcriptional regulator [Corynebacterium otitidis]
MRERSPRPDGPNEPGARYLPWPAERPRLPDEWTRWASYGYQLAVNLQVLRRWRGVSQEWLGYMAGLSRNQVSNLERNENSSGRPSDPSLSTIYRLAHALGVPPAVLLPAPGEEVGEVRRSGPDLLVDITWPGPDEAEETGDPEAERRLIELLREAFPAAVRGRGDGSGEPGEDAGR